MGLLGILCLFLIWHISASQSNFPDPLTVIGSFVSRLFDGSAFINSAASIQRVLVGFSLGATGGIALGILCGTVPSFRLFLSPVVEFLRPIPPIAWIPLAIFFFDVGDRTAYFIVFLGAFFPTFVNTLSGVSSVPKQIVEAAELMGASRLKAVLSVIIPAARPQIIVGLSVGLGFSWMVLVAAEMVAAETGLGYQISIDRTLLNIAGVIAGMAMIGLLGLVLTGLLLASTRARNYRDIPALFETLRGYKRPKRLFSNLVSRLSPKFSVSVTREELSQLSDLLKLTPNYQTSIGQRQPKPVSVELADVTFSYEKEAELVVRNMSYLFEKGEITYILGPSGAGKTTLLRLIAGLETPNSGNILIGDEAPKVDDPTVGMLFQSRGLFPWLSALRNVSFPLRVRGHSKAQAISDAASYLDTVGLLDLGDRRPENLSGGQQQRVAIARALADSNGILLVDEAFSGLDLQARESLQDFVFDLVRSRGMSLIAVTHDLYEAAYMADKVLIFDDKGQMARLNHLKNRPANMSRTSTSFHERVDAIRASLRHL